MEDIVALEERAKELRCLYAIDAVLADRRQTLESVFNRIVEEIPAGWQNPSSTGACIEYLNRRFVGPGFAEGAPLMERSLSLMGLGVGRLVVSDSTAGAMSGTSDFLEEEGELLRRVSRRIEEFLEWKHAEMLGAQTPRDRNHWAWRKRFAEAMAGALEAGRFGVSRIYLGGSTARGEAGPGSDIDLYIQSDGSEGQRRELSLWIEGWSLCLGQVALEQTGQSFPEGIMNIQWLDAEPDMRQRAEYQELTLGRAVGSDG